MVCTDVVKSAYRSQRRDVSKSVSWCMVCRAATFLSPSGLFVASEDCRTDGHGGRCNGDFLPCTEPLPRQPPVLFLFFWQDKLAKKGERVPHLASVAECICT